MSIKVLIVDDEPIAREMINILLTEYNSLQVVGEASNGEEALKLIDAQTPDLLFLDIQMPGMTGISLAQKLAGFRGHLVFVTAYDEYALAAFELNAIDYLLKPFTKKRFHQTIEKVQSKFQQASLNRLEDKLLQLAQDYNQLKTQVQPTLMASNDTYLSRFVARQANKIVFIVIEEVEAIVGASDYIEVHHAGNKSLVNTTLQETAARLNPEDFIRIHRSYILPVKQIKEIVPHFNGEYFFVMKNGQKYKSGRTYKSQVQRLFQ
ncbi:LytTR family DNA-binding domain-containing protein [uncultured Microscilla sp.]|uniref:LytR/AlgR family response regulator transcription factor n=1 Tax=uncultured Microscilla sp. TaxID=432653 RepID=UPI002630D267|nr:LytTR family DNA-binding domain-containing protein [uncultured Microscilla sp.]